MPRGNDETAARDLAAKHGSEGVGNAEELIEAVQASRTPELEAAQMKPLDEEATTAIDLSTLSGPNGEPAVSAAVRGGVTVVVYVDEKGGYSKCVASDAKKKPAKAKAASTKSDDEK